MRQLLAETRNIMKNHAPQNGKNTQGQTQRDSVFFLRPGELVVCTWIQSVSHGYKGLHLLPGGPCSEHQAVARRPFGLQVQGR